MFSRKKAPHLIKGARGERAAALYLLFRGYRILERNYLCPRGEIDIVAMKKGVVVFVEVRTRQAEALVNPIGSINDMKLARFVDTARHFLTVRKKGGAQCRFDIISVNSQGFFPNRITHYKNAFLTTDERPVRGQRLQKWVRRQPRFRTKK